MARKIKFALKMPGDVSVRTIEELKQNFDLASVLEYYFNGKLVEWLLDRRHNEHADVIAKLDNSKADFKQELCRVFGVDYQEIENVAVEEVAELIEKRQILKEYTDDETILEKADEVIFEQQELNELLKDDKEQTIYLFGEEFTISVKYKNKKYVGVNNPKIKMPLLTDEKLIDLNVKFENIVLPESVKKCFETLKDKCLKANDIHLEENYADNNIPVLMSNLSEYDYGESLIYVYENKEVFITYNKYRSFGERNGLLVVDGDKRVDITSECSVESSHPIFIKGRHIYYLRRKGRDIYGEQLIQYDIKTNQRMVLRDKVSEFVVCDNKIIYYVWNGKTAQIECYYDVFENNLEFNNEMFVSRESHNYNFKIKNSQIHTVGHNYVKFYWKEPPLPLNEVNINIVNIDNVIREFMSICDLSKSDRLISDELHKRGLSWHDTVCKYDLYHLRGIALYKEFLEGDIKIIGVDEFEFRKIDDISYKTLVPNKNLEIVQNGNDWRCVKEHLDWLEERNIKIDKMILDLLKRKIAYELKC